GSAHVHRERRASRVPARSQRQYGVPRKWCSGGLGARRSLGTDGHRDTFLARLSFDGQAVRHRNDRAGTKYPGDYIGHSVVRTKRTAGAIAAAWLRRRTSTRSRARQPRTISRVTVEAAPEGAARVRAGVEPA